MSVQLSDHTLCDIRAVSKAWNDPKVCVKSFSVASDLSTARVHYFNQDGRYWYSLTVYYDGKIQHILNSCLFLSSRNRSCACLASLKYLGFKEVV